MARKYKRDRRGRFAGGPISGAVAKRISKPANRRNTSITFRAGSITTRRIELRDSEIVIARMQRRR